MRFGIAAVSFCLVEAAQFGFPCSVEMKWCLFFGAPLSIAVALIVDRLTHRRLAYDYHPFWFWALVGILALIGLPTYALGHICG